MKPIKIMALVPAILISIAAQAHDPKEHMQEEKPLDCSMMKNMDPADMDMNDPVMQAMHKKCAKALQEGGRKENSDEHQHGDNEEHHAH